MSKKLLKLLSILMIVSITIIGCTKETNNNKEISNKEENEVKYKITTSFYPMYLFTKEITKGIEGVEVNNMTNPSNGCLHDYSLTTENLKILEDSDVFVINGGGMEGFMDTVLEQKRDLNIIDSSEDIELLVASHDHDHDHDHENESSEAEKNAHIWLDVNNAIKQIENIKNKLSEYNPENKEKYEENYNTYKEELVKLDNDLKNEIFKLNNKNIVTFHEAFPYFANAYGLNIVSIVQREAGSEPSAKELQETIENIKKVNVKAVFVEPQYPTKTAETIAKETNTSVYTLDPIVTNEKDKTYIEIMKDNLEVLKEALK